MNAPEDGLTLFCPVFNEEDLLCANVERLLSFLSAELNCPFEIIIASNGSTDRTVELGEKLSAAHPAVRFFHLPEKGVGTAFAEGVRRARYGHFITVDMDLSIDLEFIPKAHGLLCSWDMVIGSKIMGDQKRPWFRKAVSNLFIRLAGVLLGIGFHDYSIAAKGYRTETARKYLHMVDAQTFYVVSIACQAAKDGGRITEVPVSCHDMRGSRFNLMHEGFYKFGNLFLLWIKNLLKLQR